MSTTALEKSAAALLALEALGIAVLVGWELTALVGGDVANAPTSFALLALTAVGAAAVAAFAVGVWRDRSWGRSGGIVTQLLILAVALGAVTGTYGQPSLGAALAVPGVVGFVLLVAAGRAAARRAGQTSS